MSSVTRATFGRLGLVALAVIFVVVVSLANQILRGARIDLTENRLYTMSPDTTKALGNIAEPINLYLFISDKATADIPYLRAYADRVRDMLHEFERYSNGKLTVTQVDPVPFAFTAGVNGLGGTAVYVLTGNAGAMGGCIVTMTGTVGVNNINWVFTNGDGCTRAKTGVGT